MEQGPSGPTDRMPEILGAIEAAGKLPGFPFPGWFLSSLGLIPNEYLFYYYFREESLAAQRRQVKTRGETITEMNRAFLAELDPLLSAATSASPGTAFPDAVERYYAYILARQESSLTQNLLAEKVERTDPAPGSALDRFRKAISAAVRDHEGYPGVALDVIGGLCGRPSTGTIVNVRNQGSIPGMADTDVVEIPVLPALTPVRIGPIPRHCLGLMLQVKEFEKRTIEAFAARSRVNACTALALHPLIGDIDMAQALVGDLEAERGSLFPRENGDFGQRNG